MKSKDRHTESVEQIDSSSSSSDREDRPRKKLFWTHDCIRPADSLFNGHPGRVPGNVSGI
jgi:hypothetical protein